MNTDRDTTPTHLLLRQHRTGDPSALNTLFARHWEPVFRILRVRLRGQPPAGCEIEDLVQEAMMAAIEGLEQFEPREDAAWRDWVVTIAWRRMLNHVRAARVGKRWVQAESLQTQSGSWRQIRDPAANVVAEVVHSEAKQRIDQCVSQLTGSHRVVILERDYLGRDWPAIAAILGRGVGACQQLHLRARMKLAEMLSRTNGHADETNAAAT